MVGHLFSSRLAIELIIFLVPIQKCLFLFLKNTFHITSYRNRATETQKMQTTLSSPWHIFVVMTARGELLPSMRSLFSKIIALTLDVIHARAE